MESDVGHAVPVTFDPPVAIVSCAANSSNSTVTLTWTNGSGKYSKINVTIDGKAAAGSPLPGTSESYVSAPLAPAGNSRSNAGAATARAALPIAQRASLALAPSTEARRSPTAGSRR